VESRNKENDQLKVVEVLLGKGGEPVFGRKDRRVVDGEYNQRTIYACLEMSQEDPLRYTSGTIIIADFN
jgi:hypothetical protein